MKVVTFDGRSADTGEIESAEAGGMLAEMDGKALRLFLIGIAMAGGARRKTIAKALRCTPLTIRRDIKASESSPETTPDT